MFIVHTALATEDAVELTDGVDLESLAVAEISTVNGDVLIGNAADDCYRHLSDGGAVSYGVNTGDALWVKGVSASPGMSIRVTAVFHAGTSGGGGGSGTPGADGKTVLNGTGAPTSGDGDDGDFWINTTAHTLFGPKASGAWPGSGVSLVGPQGATGTTGSTGTAGAAGNTVRNGAIVPASGTGVNGDFYINTATWDIYGPKTGSGWGSPTSLIGPAA